jgi:nucleotide-binding universal stress UspA family protein
VINIRDILYPTDFSPYANQAYFHAIALAESHGARLTVVHVQTPGAVVPTGAGAGGTSAGDDPSRAQDYWREQLGQIRPLNPAIPVSHVLLAGDPAEEILRHAAANRADLIVMGTHGRTGLLRLLMGSVAEKVLRGAPCSVLVVKMPRATPLTEKSEAAEALSPA